MIKELLAYYAARRAQHRAAVPNAFSQATCDCDKVRADEWPKSRPNYGCPRHDSEVYARYFAEHRATAY